jgi:hypothetical protein
MTFTTTFKLASSEQLRDAVFATGLRNATEVGISRAIHTTEEVEFYYERGKSPRSIVR